MKSLIDNKSKPDFSDPFNLRDYALRKIAARKTNMICIVLNALTSFYELFNILDFVTETLKMDDDK